MAGKIFANRVRIGAFFQKCPDATVRTFGEGNDQRRDGPPAIHTCVNGLIGIGAQRQKEPYHSRLSLMAGNAERRSDTVVTCSAMRNEQLHELRIVP